jgi:hypothetical protein
MAQTFTPTAVTSGEGAQLNYPLQLDRGLPGQIADLSLSRVITGANETGAVLAFGVPVNANSAGVLANSCKLATAAGAILGISVRSAVHEKVGIPAPGAAPSYTEGVPDLKAVNILTAGTIYLEVMEAVAPGDTLRFHKSGTHAGKWGKTASNGNTLALAAGGWVIRKAGAAGQVLALEINSPAELTFTADTAQG